MPTGKPILLIVEQGCNGNKVKVRAPHTISNAVTGGRMDKRPVTKPAMYNKHHAAN